MKDKFFMDKESIKLNNTIKFNEHKTTDEKLRQLDNKLSHINKKIDIIIQSTFILNRTIKDIEEKSKKPYQADTKRYSIRKVIIKKIKITAIKINIFLAYLYFNFLNNKKTNINKKISELL